MEFLSHFTPIVLCSNLFCNFFEIGEKLLKNPFSFLTVHKKGSKSNFMERNTIFCKRILLRSDTFLSRFQTCWNIWYVKMRTKVVKLQKTHSSMQTSIPNLTQKQTIFAFNSIFSLAKPRLYFLKSCLSTLEEYH